MPLDNNSFIIHRWGRNVGHMSRIFLHILSQLNPLGTLIQIGPVDFKKLSEITEINETFMSKAKDQRMTLNFIAQNRLHFQLNF